MIFSLIFVTGGFLVLSAEGESNIIPEWIKKTAYWWSQDQISETEYIESLQYLIDNKIIAVDPSIEKVYASNVVIPNEQRAQSFVVRIQSVHYDFKEEYYTFIQFFNRDDTVGIGQGAVRSSVQSPEILLASLPSHDKVELYNYVGKTFEPGTLETLELNIEVDVIAGDGKIIQTWDYEDCTLRDYGIFLEFDNTLDRWSQEEGPEIQERFVFECKGIDLFSESHMK